MISEKVFDTLGNKELISWLNGLLDILDKRGVKIYNSENKEEYIENLIIVNGKLQYITDMEMN